MNPQYIHDTQGNATGVFIPIDQWLSLKQKYSQLQKEESLDSDIPEWHKKIVLDRLKNPQTPVDAFEMIDKLDK